MPSRGDRPPTAAELCARMTVASPVRASGRFRFEGGFLVGFGHSGARPFVMGLPSPEVRFHFQDPGRWSVLDDAGLVRGVDADRAVVRHHEQGLVSLPADRLRIGIGPERFLQPDPANSDDEPAATDWQGRPAWRLGPLVVDDATGIVLRQKQGESWAEITDLDFETPAAAHLFELPEAPAWDPPPDPNHPVEDRLAWGDRPRPTVTWTPSGLAHHPLDGDVETGWLVQQVRCLTPAGAIYLQLHRRPDGVDAPLPDAHRWSADGCEWALEVSETGEGVDPLTDDELAAMADSVDTATPWPAIPVTA